MMRSSAHIGMILAAASLAGGMVIVRDRDDHDLLDEGLDLLKGDRPERRYVVVETEQRRTPAAAATQRRAPTVDHKHSREIARRLRQEARNAAARLANGQQS